MGRRGRRRGRLGRGLAFEAVGDAQLAAYKRRPREQRPPVLDTGLWGWTRHLQLLRGRVRVVGHLAGRRPRVGLAPGLLTVVAPGR
ncbi:MAG: DUF1295 domain-containing protein [Nocardioides sp.]